MPEFDRAAAQARCDAATEGPWIVGPVITRGTSRRLVLTDAPGRGLGEADDQIGRTFETVDAEFIAHAREDLPNALRALEEAEAENRQLRDALRGLVVGVELYCPVSVRNAIPSYLTEPWNEARAALSGETQ